MTIDSAERLGLARLLGVTALKRSYPQDIYSRANALVVSLPYNGERFVAEIRFTDTDYDCRTESLCCSESVQALYPDVVVCNACDAVVNVPTSVALNGVIDWSDYGFTPYDGIILQAEFHDALREAWEVGASALPRPVRVGNDSVSFAEEFTDEESRRTLSNSMTLTEDVSEFRLSATLTWDGLTGAVALERVGSELTGRLYSDCCTGPISLTSTGDWICNPCKGEAMWGGRVLTGYYHDSVAHWRDIPALTKSRLSRRRVRFLAEPTKSAVERFGRLEQAVQAEFDHAVERMVTEWRGTALF